MGCMYGVYVWGVCMGAQYGLASYTPLTRLLHASYTPLTRLLHACMRAQYGLDEIAYLLLEAGANVNAPDRVLRHMCL